jgi:gamma-glutamylcyclotransferase (GGCT)/AIG2-like uncharacterized protein YtfP
VGLHYLHPVSPFQESFPAPAMNVFTYGSLMYPDVFAALAGERLAFEDLAVPGFERRAIAGKPYPGLRENPAASVDGRLWFGVGAGAMRMLDAFEGALYERRTLRLMSPGRGRVEAEVYVVPRDREHLLADDPWDRHRFESRYLERYVKLCRGFRASRLAGEG